jgi:hypothetical protein
MYFPDDGIAQVETLHNQSIAQNMDYVKRFKSLTEKSLPIESKKFLSLFGF